MQDSAENLDAAYCGYVADNDLSHLRVIVSVSSTPVSRRLIILVYRSLTSLDNERH